MSFLKSTTSFTRFIVLDEVSKDVLYNIPELLKQYAFKDIDNITLERALGWTSFDDLLDTQWERSIPEKADYICFSLRLDTRRIPPAVFKKYVRLALMEEEKKILEVGKKFVPKDRKAEIKEQVRLQLLSRFLPIPAEFQAIWLVEKQRVYFASTQAKVIESFMEHFILTFGVHLEQITSYPLAIELLGEEVGVKLDSIQETHFV